MRIQTVAVNNIVEIFCKIVENNYHFVEIISDFVEIIVHFVEIISDFVEIFVNLVWILCKIVVIMQGFFKIIEILYKFAGILC